MKVKTHGAIGFDTLSILEGVILEVILNDLVDETPLGRTSKPMYLTKIGDKYYNFPTYHAENVA